MQQNQNLPLRELLEDAWEEVYDLHDLMVIEEDAQDLSLGSIEIKSSSFSGCSFLDSRFQGTGFDHVTFRNCDLSGCSFSGCGLREVTFLDCRMMGTNFSDCTLSHCRLEGCHGKYMGLVVCDLEAFGDGGLQSLRRQPVPVQAGQSQGGSLRFYPMRFLRGRAFGTGFFPLHHRRGHLDHRQAQRMSPLPPPRPWILPGSLA